MSFLQYNKQNTRGDYLHVRVVVLELLGSPSPPPATFYVYYLKGSQISKTRGIITDIWSNSYSKRFVIQM